MRPDATPQPGHLRAGAPAAVPRFLLELAQVGEIDLVEGLGPDRLAALARLAGTPPATTERRRRRRIALLASLALALAAALAAALRLG